MLHDHIRTGSLRLGSSTAGMALCIAAVIGCTPIGQVSESGAPGLSDRPEATDLLAGSPPATPEPDQGPELTGIRLAYGANQAWALTDEGLFDVSLGTLEQSPTWEQTHGLASSIAADAETVAVALVVDRSTVVVRSSTDDARTWATSTPIDFSGLTRIDGICDVQLAIAGRALALVAQRCSGVQVSVGYSAASRDGGSTWSVSRAPAAGGVSRAAGVFWLVGGPQRQAVFTSADGLTWTSVDVPAQSVYWTFGSASAVGDGGIAIPAIALDPSPGNVTWLTSDDFGKSWNDVASFPWPQVEFATDLPLYVLPDGRWTAVSPDGSKARSGQFGSGTEDVILSPNSLPPGVMSIVPASGHGIVAEIGRSSCPTGKDSCTAATSLMFSPDGGQTWSPLR